MGQGACPKTNSYEYDLAGIVTSGTSTYVNTFDPVAIRICVGRSGLSLVPGSTATL
jgi:hypothetical protein